MATDPYKKNYIRSYEDEKYPDFANDVKEWMDTRTDKVRTSAVNGTLQVLGSGFGKGALVAAALVTTAIIGFALFAPGVVGLGVGMSGAGAVEAGLMTAANFLLGTGFGVTALLTGGFAGSMLTAHNQNVRLGRDSAQQQAETFAQLREERAKSPAVEKEIENCHAQGGHCARLMQKNAEAHERGIA